jgi:hypothetical protein
MVEVVKCRRCSECAGMSHHWLPNPDFGNDEPSAISRDCEYVCKHCPALGNACLACVGEWDGDDSECPFCNGEEVVEAVL